MKNQVHKTVWISALVLLVATNAMAQLTPIPSAVQQSSGLNGAVTALAVYNGKLVIAGKFTQADGLSCNGLVTWDGTSFDTLPGTPVFGTTTGNSIYALLQYGNSLYVGGDFQTLTTDAGPVRYGHLVRYNGAGQWLQTGTNTTHPAFAATNGPVRSLHNYDGELFVGGDFTKVDINGVDLDAGHIATYDINAQGWDSVGLGSMGLTGNAATVHAMTTYQQLPTANPQLIVAGRFENADNTASRNVVIWDNILGYISINTGSFTAQIGRVHCVDTLAGKLYAGGDYNNIGLNNYFGLNAYNGSVWTHLNADIGIDRRALFACNEDFMWVGGNIEDLGRPDIHNVFIYDIAQDSAVSFSTDYKGIDGIVNTMLEFNGELYIAGEFENLLGNGSTSSIAYSNIFKVNSYCPSSIGIDNVTAETEIRYYPNPANHFFTIANVPIGSTLKVMTVTGKLMHDSVTESEQTTIHTADFANGVYILQVEINGVYANRKLVVNNQ